MSRLKQLSPHGRLIKEDAFQELREKVQEDARHFKTAWVDLGQGLFTVWKDKLFHAWGYDLFEISVVKELGIRKQLCVKLLKIYGFLEERESVYFEENFKKNRELHKLPGYEEIDVLRLAKSKKDLPEEDYARLRKSIFEKGESASLARKTLNSLIERKEIDAPQEQDKKNQSAIKQLQHCLSQFRKDRQLLKLVPYPLIEEITQLESKLGKLLEDM